tara:strand:+ start:2424 stop:2669 length:246 start_codon:yes stop_codon:yes gene_type:complete
MAKQEGCPVCLDEKIPTVKFICEHGVCEDCLHAFFLAGINKCPICRDLIIIQRASKRKREPKRQKAKTLSKQAQGQDIKKI